MISIELSEDEIQMFINAIDTAIDTKHMREEKEQRVKDIRSQLQEYLK